MKQPKILINGQLELVKSIDYENNKVLTDSGEHPLGNLITPDMALYNAKIPSLEQMEEYNKKLHKVIPHLDFQYRANEKATGAFLVDLKNRKYFIISDAEIGKYKKLMEVIGLEISFVSAFQKNTSYILLRGEKCQPQ